MKSLFKLFSDDIDEEQIWVRKENTYARIRIDKKHTFDRWCVTYLFANSHTSVINYIHSSTILKFYEFESYV